MKNESQKFRPKSKDAEFTFKTEYIKHSNFDRDGKLYPTVKFNKLPIIKKKEKEKK